MSKQIDITAEYKDDFTPSLYDGMTEVCLANSDNEVIDVKTVKNFMIDGAIRAENERAVILACLLNHEGHRILARAATEYAQETGLWSGKVIVRWRAKIYKYSKEEMEEPLTIKQHGRGKDKQFNIEPAKANKTSDKPNKDVPVEGDAVDINEDKPTPKKINRDTDSLKVKLAALQKEYGLSELVRAVTELTESIAKLNNLGTPTKKGKKVVAPAMKTVDPEFLERNTLTPEMVNGH